MVNKADGLTGACWTFLRLRNEFVTFFTLVVEQCPTPVSSTDPFKPTTVGSQKLWSGDDDATLTRYCSCANIKHIGQSTNLRCANCCGCGQTSEQCDRVGDSRADLRLLSKCSTQNKWRWRGERGNVTTSAQNSLTKRKVSHPVADLLHRHKDVVSLSEYDLGRTSRIGHHINTGNTRPIKPRPRRTSPSKK